MNKKDLIISILSLLFGLVCIIYGINIFKKYTELMPTVIGLTFVVWGVIAIISQIGNLLEDIINRLR